MIAERAWEKSRAGCVLQEERTSWQVQFINELRMHDDAR